MEELLKDLIEAAFYIDIDGNVQYSFRENVPLRRALGDRVKDYIHTHSLACANFERESPQDRSDRLAELRGDLQRDNDEDRDL